MNKQTLSKINVFFLGISSRFEEQRDFFQGLDFVFKSGTKNFPGSFNLKDNKGELSFNGEVKVIDFKNTLNQILEYGKIYDSMILKYKERGSIIVIEADDKKVSSKNEQEPEDLKPNSVSKGRNNFIKPSQASRLLKEIGIMSEDGKIKNDMIRKYNQIDHFVEVVIPILDKLKDRESITILDSACGKSYLTFVLNYYIKDVMKKKCYFIGVDYKKDVITSSEERAKRLGYKNMKFIEEDLRSYIPDEPIDMVISLHGCDIATDYAIALAIRAKAESMIVVPCCHKELKDQIKENPINPLIKHGIFKARLSDFLTDSLRALFIESQGYEVTPIEYVSPLDTPKNLMIRAVKTSDFNKTAHDEYIAIKSMFGVKPTMEKYVY